jgi:hypothetical protein
MRLWGSVALAVVIMVSLMLLAKMERLSTGHSSISSAISWHVDASVEFGASGARMKHTIGRCQGTVSWLISHFPITLPVISERR